MIITTLSVLLVGVLLLSFVGCMKVTMTEKSIQGRLDEAEYVTMAGHSIIPMSDPEMAGLRIKKCMYAYKIDTYIDQTHGTPLPRAIWEVAIYFMDDAESADKIEEIFKKYAKEYTDNYDKIMDMLEKGELLDPNLQLPKRYMVYRFDDTIVFGDWESVSLVRSY